LIVAIYHGSQRWERSTIEGSDIVITTYETIAVERGLDAGLLKQYAWFRVVLDEGLLAT
jgi:SNF2 family DNA or RNA helicase